MLDHSQTAHLDAAAATFNGDWDADGTATLTMPLDFATEALTLRGWRPSRHGWISPEGDPVPSAGEALTLALMAEVIAHR